MTQLRGIKLNLPKRAKFHFGDSSGNLNKIFSSDKLFSALINNASLLYSPEKVRQIIERFDQDQFSISSLFYGVDYCRVVEGKQEVISSLYFLPKPYWLIRAEEVNDQDLRLRKQAKKITFLSLGAYQELLKSWSDEEKYFKYNLLDLPTVGDTFAYSNEEAKTLPNIKVMKNAKFISEQSSQKLQVNRFNDSSDTTYYQNELEVSQVRSGNYLIKPFMYFLYRGELMKEIRGSLNLLSDEGIGGKRSRGLGYFENIEEVKIPLEDHRDGGYFTSLSIIYPRESDIDGIESYQLCERNGYIYSLGGTPFRKKSARILTEGSIFSKDVKGQVVDVTPSAPNFCCDHQIFLNGKAFLFPFGGNER